MLSLQTDCTTTKELLDAFPKNSKNTEISQSNNPRFIRKSFN